MKYSIEDFDDNGNVTRLIGYFDKTIFAGFCKL